MGPLIGGIRTTVCQIVFFRDHLHEYTGSIFLTLQLPEHGYLLQAAIPTSKDLLIASPVKR